ncbi:MAG: hypothetical protein WA208_02975 [Thermoanaerobaculia bacterium]
MSGEWEPIGRGSVAAWLRLAKPIPATLGACPMLVLDLGQSGALLSGLCEFAQGTEHDLAFLDDRHDVSVRCRITAVAEHGVTPDRDLLVRFIEPGVGLAEFIARYEQQVHRAEIANFEGDIEGNVIDGDRMLSDLGAAARANEPFLRCQFSGGRWHRELTASRDQPADGFTISAAEAEEQLRLLQLAYEETDEAGRRAMREFASVSLPTEP